MKSIKIPVLMLFGLLLSVALFAQRGRGNNNQRYNRGYSNYNKPYYHNNSRSRVTVQVGPRYNYGRVYSRPYYRPVYRPIYRPVYRPVYRPIYRSPRAYVHFGPVFGVRINTLPYGYSRIYVGADPYYYNNGVYYRPYNNNNNNAGYEVVAPPLNATVNRLPANATITMIDGQKFYQVGGTFYQEELDENEKLMYRVVGTNGVINTAQEQQPYTQEMQPQAPPAEYETEQPVMRADDEEPMNALDEAIPTVGSRYDALPLDSKVQVINYQKYFVSPRGIYYIEVIEGDKIRYEVTTVGQ